MRNAGDAPTVSTTWVPVPLLNTGGGTQIDNLHTFPLAFLISLVFTVRRTFAEIVGTSERTENSTAFPREKQYLKLHSTAYIQNAHSFAHRKTPPS